MYPVLAKYAPKSILSPADLGECSPPSRPPQGNSRSQDRSSRTFPQEDRTSFQSATPRRGFGQSSRQGDTWPRSTVPPTQAIRRGSPGQQTRGSNDEDDDSESQDRSGETRGRMWDMSGLRRSIDDDRQGNTGPQYGSRYRNYGRYEDEQHALTSRPIRPAIGRPAADSSHPPPHSEDPQRSRRWDEMREDLRSGDVQFHGLWRDPVAFSGKTVPKQRQMPAGLRLIFGLDYVFPDNLGFRSASSGRVSPSGQNASRQSALSHQKVWDRMMTMDKSGGFPEALSAKPRTNGPIFTLIPSPTADGRTLCPLQMKFKGAGTIPDEDADISCSSLGIDRLITKLNGIFGTNYGSDRTASLRMWFSAMMKNISSADVGLAYGFVRRTWFGNIHYQLARSGYGSVDDRRRQAINGDVITDPRIPPRRVWDLYSNRVLPFRVLLGADVPMKLWAVSHSWVPDSQLKHVWTPINGYMWPVPIPLDVDLSQIRIELLNLGAEYVWLDVLCLRQEIPPATMLHHPKRNMEDMQQWRDSCERTRREEWRLDVPTIGYVYRCKPSQVVVSYFNGLGRPFRLSAESLEGEDSANHWINRVWTMQEATSNWFLGGLTPQPFDEGEPGVSDTIKLFHQRMSDLLAVLPQGQTPPDLFALVSFLRLRHARRENDYVSGLGYLLQCPVIPIYDETISVEIAWERLVCQLESKSLTDLLFLFPIAGTNPKARWRPSWGRLLRDPLTPLSTSSVAYLRQDLVRYDPGSGEYSNIAYIVDRCVLHSTGTAGRLQLQVPIEPSDGDQAAPRFITIAISSSNPSLGKPLADAEYTIAATADLKYWLYGKPVRESKKSITLEKCGTFVVDDAEDIETLWHLNPGYADMRVIYA